MKTIAASLSIQGLILMSFSGAVAADQVILDDLIVDGSMCVGSACTENEAFDFDSIIYKSDDPVVRFQDTSSSSSFPTSVLAMGFSDEASSVTPYFYIRDVDAGQNLLILQSGSDGGIAIGAGAHVESNAVSVGSEEKSRRIIYVADGVADNDAANMAQFNAFTSSAEAKVTGEITKLDTDIATLQTSMDDLKTRLVNLADRIDALTP